MATLTFTFDTGTITTAEILDAFAKAYNYQVTINGQPNPETKAVFARRQVRRYILDIVRSQRHDAAKTTAIAAVVEPVFTD